MNMQIVFRPNPLSLSLSPRPFILVIFALFVLKVVRFKKITASKLVDTTKIICPSQNDFFPVGPTKYR